MRTTKAGCWLVAAAALWGAPVQQRTMASEPVVEQTSALVELPPLVVTDRTRFAVPFDLTPPQPGASPPRVVRLYGSRDLGFTWQLCQEIAPAGLAALTAGSFDVQLSEPAEYWFLVRTVATDGTMAPITPGEVELRVKLQNTGAFGMPVAPGVPGVLPSGSPIAGVPVSLPRSLAVMTLDALPPHIMPQMVRATTFDLDYDVPHFARGALQSVELWRTDDGGRSWQMQQQDADCMSPVRVSVPSDGVFGFTLAVTAIDGRQSPAPQPGDAPQYWVGVDSVKPTARLTMAEARSHRGRRQLVVHWEAADAQLAPEPISLHYAKSPHGPWQPLALRLPNRGSHDCELPSDAGQAIYLRLEACDAAGNHQVHCATEPVLLSSTLSGTGRTAAGGSRVYHVFADTR